MDGRNSTPPCDCTTCQGDLQEYLDGTLDKNQSLQIFLHLRECDTCRAEHERMQALFLALDSLPDVPVPEEFDDAVLASVPYAAYKEMAPLRAVRVPVYLEETFLPAAVRAPLNRLAGVAIAAIAAGVNWVADGPQWLLAFSVIGLLPELLVRLQGVSRWATLLVRRSAG